MLIQLEFSLNIQLVLFLLLFAGFVWVSLELAYIDHHLNRLPNRYTFLLLFVGFAVNLNALFVSWSESLFGATMAYVICRIYHDINLRWRGSAGFGLGDAKYLAALSAWFGIQFLPSLLIGASIYTLVAYSRRLHKPFGVGLSLSAIAIWFYSASIPP